jgi:integrase
MASLLLAQGVNPKIDAERLGDSVEITLSVYSHMIPSMQNDAALALEKALAG